MTRDTDRCYVVFDWHEPEPGDIPGPYVADMHVFCDLAEAESFQRRGGMRFDPEPFFGHPNVCCRLALEEAELHR
jgi:hypothetical protein